MQLLDMVIPRLNLVQLDAYKFDIGEKEVNKFHAILYGTKEEIRFTTVNKGLIISSLHNTRSSQQPGDASLVLLNGGQKGHKQIIAL